MDVDVIANNIRKQIEIKKIENEDLLNFISFELSKENLDGQENILDKVVNYIEDKYHSKEEVKAILQTKINNFQQIAKMRNELQADRHQASTYDVSSLGSSSNIFGNMKSIFNKLEKNRDLSDLRDGVFHFSKNHMGLAKRIFFLQVTQNYLAAVKYIIINDLVTRQSSFNAATEDALKNIMGMMDEFRKEEEISIKELQNYKSESETSIKELQNYKNESEKWIQYNESRIFKLEEKLKNFESDLMSKEDENIHAMQNLEGQIDSNTHKFDEMYITVVYNMLRDRDPAPWEMDCWYTAIKTGLIHHNELVSKIKNMHESQQITQKYLLEKGISFVDNDTALRKIDEHSIYFDANDHILVDVFSQNNPPYEGTTLSVINKLLKNSMNVINIGANVGYLTLLLAKLVGPTGKVFAFEPYEKNVKFLQKNIEKNGYKNVEISPIAVSNKNGKAQLWLKPSAAWHFISDKKIPGLKKIDIESITIDSFLANRKTPIDLVVIDAEGSEQYIMEGMKQTIKENPDLEIIAEYNPYTLEAAGTNGEAFLGLVNELGFSIYLIDENKNKVRPVTKEEILYDFRSPKFTNIFLTKKPKAISV